MKRVRSIEQVVSILGVETICKLTDANPKQAWHWYGRARQFPANTYVVLQRALNARGYEAPARLWSMVGVDKAA